MRRHFHLFGKQAQRFGTTLAQFVGAVFVHDPRMLLKVLGYSVLGAGSQGAALASVLYIIGRMEETDDVNRIEAHLPLLDPMIVPTGAAFAVCLVLLAIATFGLYKAEANAMRLAAQFANARSGRFITLFPLFSDRARGTPLDPATGNPQNLKDHVKMRGRRMFMAARSVVRSPVALLQLGYGLAFTLYLEPLLTILLIIALAPLLYPFRTFSRDVQQAERERSELSGGAREIDEMLDRADHVSLRELLRSKHLSAAFQKTSLAQSIRLIQRRLIGMARAESLGNAALAITFALAVVYFSTYRGLENISVGKVVIYFVSLQIAAFAGRQLARRITKFARFYEGMREVFHVEQDRGEHVPPDTELLFKANRIGTDSRMRSKFVPGKPVAVLGRFPLTSMAMGHIAVMQGRDDRPSHADIVSSIVYIPFSPEVISQQAWHELLDLANEDDRTEIHRIVNALGPDLGAMVSDIDPGQAIAEAEPDLDESRIAELLLLALASSRQPILVAPSTALDKVSPEFREAWYRAVEDKRVLVYHRSRDGGFRPVGEEWGVVVGTRGEALAQGDPGELAEKPELVNELFDKDIELANAERSSFDGDADDDED